jgi:hypothetical protein
VVGSGLVAGRLGSRTMAGRQAGARPHGRGDGDRWRRRPRNSSRAVPSSVRSSRVPLLCLRHYCSRWELAMAASSSSLPRSCDPVYEVWSPPRGSTRVLLLAACSHARADRARTRGQRPPQWMMVSWSRRRASTVRTRRRSCAALAAGRWPVGQQEPRPAAHRTPPRTPPARAPCAVPTYVHHHPSSRVVLPVRAVGRDEMTRSPGTRREFSSAPVTVDTAGWAISFFFSFARRVRVPAGWFPALHNRHRPACQFIVTRDRARPPARPCRPRARSALALALACRPETRRPFPNQRASLLLPGRLLPRPVLTPREQKRHAPMRAHARHSGFPSTSR